MSFSRVWAWGVLGFLCCIDVAAGAQETCTKSGTCAERRKGDVLLMQLKPQLKRGIEEAVPDPAAFFLPACCLGCHHWCSPKSGQCHDMQAKSYYKPCARSTQTIPGALLWADEFEGNEVNLSNWVQMTGVEEVKDGQLHYTDHRTNSFVENGVLKIVASCEESEMGKYTSAKLSTQDRFHWGPGHRLEIRARVPKGRGLWPAIFMLPSKGGPWPETGEIDIMEVSGCVAGKVSGAVHMGGFNQMRETQSSNHYFAEYDKWHTYSIDWASDHINWYVDGQLYHTARPSADGADGPWPFREKFFLNMNLAVNALWASGCHESKALSCEDLGQAMEVDYVRVHELKAKDTTS